MKYVLAVTYALMILATNWALGRWGFVPLLGVSSMMVPAGVYFAGLTFGVRDAMQQFVGAIDEFRIVMDIEAGEAFADRRLVHELADDDLAHAGRART